MMIHHCSESPFKSYLQEKPISYFRTKLNIFLLEHAGFFKLFLHVCYLVYFINASEVLLSVILWYKHTDDSYLCLAESG